MAKYACPNCKTVIEATPDIAVVVCPNCGKKYKNPRYVAPANAAPEEKPAPEAPAEKAAPQTQNVYPPMPPAWPAPYPQPYYGMQGYVFEAEATLTPTSATVVPAVPAAPAFYSAPAAPAAPTFYVAPTHTAPAPTAATPAAPATEKNPALTQDAPVKESKFTGTMLSWLGHRLFNFFLTLITLGLAYPWVVCRGYRWEISHKVIDGRKLTFEGRGISLLGHWLLWVLLTIITIGIYGLWVPCKLQAWITERTHIA